MVLFSSEHPLFRAFGLFLLILQLNVFIFGLPPFHVGIWVQTEPLALATYLISMLTALWLALGISKQWLVKTSSPPLWTALLLWTLWQCLPTIMAISPWRSWFGPPETSEGTAFYVSLLFTTMLAFPLWQRAHDRRILLLAATSSIAIMCILYVTHDRPADGLFSLSEWTPVQWPSFLAFPAMYLAIAAIVSGYCRRPKHTLLTAIMLMAVLLISHNRSGIVVSSAAIITSVIALRLRLTVTHFWRAIMIGGCFLPCLWIAFSVLDPNLPLFADKDGGLGSRAVLNQVAISTIQHEPSRPWLGGGWGRFHDDIFKYILVDGITVYRGEYRAPNCFMVDGGAFHSHSQPLEALLSLGLPGLLLWFSIPVLALATIPARYFWPVAPMLVALTTLGFFWFQLLECMPFAALMYVALMQSNPVKHGHGSRGMTSLMLILSVVMGWSTLQQTHALIYDAKLKAMATIEINEKWLDDDIAHGGDRLRTAATWYLPRFAASAKQNTLTSEQIESYAQFSQTVHAMAQSSQIGPWAAFLDLWTHHFTLSALPGPLFDSTRQQAEATLPATVIDMAGRAPLRDDVATPFLQNIDIYSHNDPNMQIDWLKQLLQQAPNHRGALWTLGNILKHSKSNFQNGELLCNRAAMSGGNTVFPLLNP